jgi:hypothetical protein
VSKVKIILTDMGGASSGFESGYRSTIDNEAKTQPQPKKIFF